MVTIVNYGLGNIQAFYHIYTRLNIPVSIASTPEELCGASKLILPGVGSFDWAMQRLNVSGMRNTLDELVLEKQVPVLGICVGMQMMARSSEEGVMPGLGWLEAHVNRFDFSNISPKILLPHMGWNDVKAISNSVLFAGIDLPRFYFLHSYYFVPRDSSQILSTTHYGIDFTSSVCERHIYGVQFHPEKSHEWGISMLKNFATL